MHVQTYCLHIHIARTTLQFVARTGPLTHLCIGLYRNVIGTRLARHIPAYCYVSWKGLPRAHVASAEKDLYWVADQGHNTSEARHEHCGVLVGRLSMAVPIGAPN